MVLILMANDVFEPSYDLKFTVWNYKYFCTNLNVKHAIEHFTHFSLHVGKQCFTLVFSCVPQQLLKPEIRWMLLSTFWVNLSPKEWGKVWKSHMVLKKRDVPHIFYCFLNSPNLLVSRGEITTLVLFYGKFFLSFFLFVGEERNKNLAFIESFHLWKLIIIIIVNHSIALTMF